MKSLTIHDISIPLYTLIKSKAEEQNLSLNKMIKVLLEKSVGIQQVESPQNKEFAPFCGIWKPKDLQEFANSTKDLRPIDDEDWQ